MYAFNFILYIFFLLLMCYAKVCCSASGFVVVGVIVVVVECLLFEVIRRKAIEKFKSIIIATNGWIGSTLSCSLST